MNISLMGGAANYKLTGFEVCKSFSVLRKRLQVSSGLSQSEEAEGKLIKNILGLSTWKGKLTCLRIPLLMEVFFCKP